MKAYFHYLRSFFSYSIMLMNCAELSKGFYFSCFCFIALSWMNLDMLSTHGLCRKFTLKNWVEAFMLLPFRYRNCLVLAQGPRSSRGSNKVTNKNTMQNKWRCWASFAIFFIFHLHDFNNRIKNSSESENLPRGCGPAEQHYSLFQAATGLQLISVWY